eukprot:jgi/Mesvir1/13620/Mv06710-RA.1
MHPSADAPSRPKRPGKQTGSELKKKKVAAVNADWHNDRSCKCNNHCLTTYDSLLANPDVWTAVREDFYSLSDKARTQRLNSIIRSVGVGNIRVKPSEVGGHCTITITGQVHVDVKLGDGPRRQTVTLSACATAMRKLLGIDSSGWNKVVKCIAHSTQFFDARDDVGQYQLLRARADAERLHHHQAHEGHQEEGSRPTQRPRANLF